MHTSSRSRRRPFGGAALAALTAALTAALLVGTPASQAQAAGTPRPPASPGPVPSSVVVKVAGGHSVNEIVAAYPVTVQSTLLASRSLYLLWATNASDRAKLGSMKALAKRIARSAAVTFAEPNYETSLHSSRYVSWPEGQPVPTDGGAAAWLDQPASSALDLGSAHDWSQGLGIRVAVLDTGVDPDSTALQGRLQGGYDYVGDDSAPTDTRENIDSNGNGTVDDAYGHGTFVAGIVSLVAPDAMIMPYRVLDSDGVGNVYIVAQAIQDATAAGARVINLSFGTDQPLRSMTLTDAIAAAEAAGVVVVAAAGNNASTTPVYPAADAGVLSVAATSGAALSTWSNNGAWVKVAAPGDSVVGPLPDGQYAEWSGTSMATPFVAGQVALIRALNRTASAATVQAAVTATASPLAGVVNGAIDIPASLAAISS